MENRKLDKWLAENVMGWKYADPLWVDEKGNFQHYGDDFAASVKYCDRWQPTTSISDAFQVVEKMKETWTPSEKERFLKILEPISKDFFLITAKDICLAAKKAIEGE